jgi:hypothetical protein
VVFQWGIQTPSGTLGAVVMEIPRDAPLSILAEHWSDEMLGDGFYEPRNATLYMISDRLNGLHRAILPDFTRSPPCCSTFRPPASCGTQPGPARASYAEPESARRSAANRWPPALHRGEHLTDR